MWKHKRVSRLFGASTMSLKERRVRRAFGQKFGFHSWISGGLLQSVTAFGSLFHVCWPKPVFVFSEKSLFRCYCLECECWRTRCSQSIDSVWQPAVHIWMCVSPCVWSGWAVLVRTDFILRYSCEDILGLWWSSGVLWFAGEVKLRLVNVSGVLVKARVSNVEKLNQWCQLFSKERS